MKLYVNYDQEADTLYVSGGMPRADDKSDEAGNDIVVRRDPRTREVRGFTILNFKRRSVGSKPFSLPFDVAFTA